MLASKLRAHVRVRGREAADEFSRDVWTQHSDELAEFYCFRFALCAAVGPEYQRATSFDLVGGATMFLRFIGLSFLVPGVVSGSLPKAWAVPAAYGDFIAGILAIIATTALARTASWALAAVWIFNIEGLVDLLFAFYKGARVNLEPGALGAGFYVVTAVVPPLLVSHVLIFELLMRSG
jgi:hypothetical protein